MLAIARPLRRNMKRATPVALSIFIRNSSLEKWSRISSHTVLQDSRLLLMFFIIIQFLSMNEQDSVATPQTNEMFSSEHGWMVQCLSLAALGLMTYLHIAPIIA